MIGKTFISTDEFSFDFIEEGLELLIEAFQQMIVHGDLIIEGDLLMDGNLILEL